MKFSILLIDTEKIYYGFSFYKYKIGILEDYIKRPKIKIQHKTLEYLFTVLRVLKDLTPELKENIICKILIEEFREEYFKKQFDKDLERELEFRIHIEDLEPLPQIEYEYQQEYYLDPDLGYYLLE